MILSEYISTSYIEISIYEKIMFVNLLKFFEKKKT